MEHCIVSDIGSAFRFATGSASSFSICAGLAGTTTLPTFTLSRFWSCYRSPGCFHPEVRPLALKGNCFQPFSTSWIFNLPLIGAQRFILLLQEDQSQWFAGTDDLTLPLQLDVPDEGDELAGVLRQQSA
jgi:hypothetical protein